MKKISLVALFLVLVLLATCAFAEDYTKMTLKFGTSSAESTLTAKTFMEWGKRLSEKTDGKVGVDVYCSSILGNNTEMVQGAQMGTIDVVVIQPAGIADMGAPKMNLLSLPYLFGSYDQYTKTLYGEVGEAYRAYLSKTKEDFAEELADIAIYLLGLAEITGVDLEAEILRKMEKNRKRVYRALENGVLVKAEGSE